MTQDLERLALEHHRRGGRWADFWQRHADAMRQAVPSYDRAGFHKLYSRLLSLVVSGDESGRFAVGDDDRAPWLQDEAASEGTPSDTTTRARLQPDALGVNKTNDPVASAEIPGKNGRSGRSVVGLVVKPGKKPAKNH